MAKIIPITEHFQHFLAEMRASFWGDLYGQTRQAWQQFFRVAGENCGSEIGLVHSLTLGRSPGVGI